MGSWCRSFAVVLVGSFAVLHAAAVSVSLVSSADTGLIEVAPTNNNGGQEFFNAGTTQSVTRNRGLLRFDLSTIPTNAVILSATVVLSVVHVPAETPADAPFSLHRVFQDWGEGTNVAGQSAGQGLPAHPGDATWSFARYASNAWSAPGGAAGMDFATLESASQFIYELGDSPYTFGPTPELTTDVQWWTAHPAANFGWLLLCDDEATPFTARRFGSRQNANSDNWPRLDVDYLIPPQIVRAEVTADRFAVGFRAETGQSYTVEFRDPTPNGAWQTLVELGVFAEVTDVLVLDPIVQPGRLYRVKVY